MAWSKLDHNKVVVTRVENNLSTNNYIIVNKYIIRATTNFVYSRESDNVLTWNTWRIDYSIDKVDCSINRSNFWITRLEIVTHLTFLTHFWSRILGHNSKYRNFIGVVTCGNH
jgi:hypothetical protein